MTDVKTKTYTPPAGTQLISMRLPAELLYAARVKCAQERRTMTEVVREALEKFVNEGR